MEKNGKEWYLGNPEDVVLKYYQILVCLKMEDGL